MSRSLGRYELLRPLARGGMAEVYVARRRVAGVEKRLVIKRIRRERATDPRFLELFVREAKLTMALAHQNIVSVFDFGRTEEHVFLAMELVEGKDLGATLTQAGAPPRPVLAAYIAAECCNALAYAHKRKDPDGAPLGIVHRDVTPRNVLLSWSGEVKLTDFGVAGLLGETANRRGTPAYMSPEQARGETTDPRTDVYALGLVLREMVTATRARRGADLAAVIAEAASGELSALPADLSPGLAAVITRATARRAEDRYDDASAMQEALDAYVLGERAKHPDAPSPARLLTTWLEEVWGDAREVEEAVKGHDEAAVTFMDDGADEILANRTVRSVAETVMDGEAGGGPPGGAGRRGDPSAVAAPRPGGLLASTQRRMAAVGVLSAAVFAAIAGVVAFGIDTGSTLPEPGKPVAELPPGFVHPPVVAPQAPPLAPEDVAAPLPDPPSTSQGEDRAPTGERKDPLRADKLPREPRVAHPPSTNPRAPTTPTTEVAPTVTRAVTIGATPWANFYVGEDPTPHQTPETLQLAPGVYRVRFENPELGVKRLVDLKVPDDRDVRHVESMVKKPGD